MLPAAGSYLDMFDEETLIPEVEHPTHGGIRLPDGRALAWAEYGSPRGLPVVLVPDHGSSRLAPTWLLHDSALPAAVRLMCLDRPGTGASDTIGLGGIDDPAEDLRHLVETLAVGRVAVIGVGQGADDMFTFAARYPQLVSSVTGVSVRVGPAKPVKRRFRLFGGGRALPAGGAVTRVLAAAHGADLTIESSWAPMLERLDITDRALFGSRWHEDDFRIALAADAAESAPEWEGLGESAARTALWPEHLEAVPVPVHLWHGRQEPSLTVSELRALVGNRPGWTVSAVDGASATLGFWAQILSTAAASFATFQLA